MLLDAMRYPFRRANLPVVALGAAFACLPPIVYSLLPALPYVGIIGLLVEAVILGYLVLFFWAVMESGTKGEADFPGWPDLTTGHDFLSRILHVVGPPVICFLPMIAFWAWAMIEGGPWVPWRIWTLAGLALAGFVYLPIAMLIFSYFGELAVFNVVGALRSVARMAADYSKVLLLLAVLLIANAAAGWAVVRLPPIVGVPLAALTGFLFMTIGMRAIGLLYHRNRDRLGWGV